MGKHLNIHTISMVSIFTFGLAISACASSDQATTLSGDEATAMTKSMNYNPPGAPAFLKAPHARDAQAGAAKLSAGYRYSQGKFDDDTFYGIYTYIDERWSYVSTSIWDTSNSSLSSGVDVSADGETWTQVGSYTLEADGTARGDYATSFINASGGGTLYLTDFSSTVDSATYHSTIDHTHTASSPDCLYDSQWKSDASTSFQTCNRPDGSFWGCSYAYSYLPQTDEQGQVVAVEYVSEQSCNDSITPFDPDFEYRDEMSWDYATGVYTDHATMKCHEVDGTARTFYYDYADGIGKWTDFDGLEIAAPTCGWSQAGSAI